MTKEGEIMDKPQYKTVKLDAEKHEEIEQLRIKIRELRNNKANLPDVIYEGIGLLEEKIKKEQEL